MAYYYSASERAFFSSEFMTVGEMPADKVAVADGTWKTLVADQSAGKIIRTGASNAPESAAQSLAALTGYAVPAGMTVAGGVSATGSISAGGALTAGGTLTVKGGASLASASVSGTMDVTGTTNLKSTLTVAGKTTAKAMSATDISASTITTTGNASVGGTLTATGAATLKNALNVAGKSTLKAVSATDIDAATLNTTGNSNVGGILTVKGSAVVGGKNVVLTVNGFTANASGAVTVPNYEQDGVTVVNSPDYNTITKPGFYHCNSTGAKSGPGYAAKMIVLGEAAAGKHLTQIAFPIHNTTSSIFCPKMRSRNMSGEWEEWKTILLAESDEDVAAKTFTSDDGFVRMTMPNIEKGVAPNATQYAYVGIYDKKGFDGTGNNRVAFFQHAVRSDGSVDTGIFSVDPNSGNVARISVGWTSDGKQISSTSATPSDNSDGSELAPTNWTRMFGGSGYGIGTVAPSVSSRFSSNDLNDINKTGFYTVSGSKNFSPGGQTTIAMHIQRAFDAGVNSAQLSFGTDSRMFIRTRVESTGWEEWAQLMKAKSRNELVNGRYIACHNVTTVKGTAPANVQWTYFALQDSSDSESEANRLAMFAHRQATNNEALARMACYKPVSGSTESVSISVGYDGSGNSFTSAPNPPDSSNDQNIATTSFVKKTVDAKAGVMTRKGSKGGAGTMTVTGLKTNQLLVVTCDMRNNTWDGGDYALVEADNVVNGWFKTGAGTGFYTTYMIATSSTVNFKITHQGISGSTTTVYTMG